MSIITLTTDLGTKDHYVIIKGEIYNKSRILTLLISVTIFQNLIFRKFLPLYLKIVIKTFQMVRYILLVLMMNYQMKTNI